MCLLRESFAQKPVRKAELQPPGSAHPELNPDALCWCLSVMIKIWRFQKDKDTNHVDCNQLRQCMRTNSCAPELYSQSVQNRISECQTWRCFINIWVLFLLFYFPNEKTRGCHKVRNLPRGKKKQLSIQWQSVLSTYYLATKHQVFHKHHLR